MGENPTPRSIWWGRADWFVFVPWFLVLASFWIYLFGPDRAPWTEASRIWSVYGRCGRPKSLIPFVGFASEWEDDLDHRDRYDKLIAEAAREFLKNAPTL
jgi:hypothetical protein